MSGPAGAAAPGDWETQLNEAVVALLVHAGEHADVLGTLRAQLARVAADARTPAPVRAALDDAVAAIDDAAAGNAPADATLHGVSDLLAHLLDDAPARAANGSAPAPSPVDDASAVVANGDAALSHRPAPAASPDAARAARPMPADVASELFPEFEQEALDYLAQAESALLELETDPAAREPVNVVFRAFHTIKGSAAFLGLDAIAALAHDAESLLSPVRDGDVAFDRPLADRMLGATDRVRALIALGPHRDAAFAAERAPAAEHGATTVPASAAAGSAGTAGAPGAVATEEWTRVRTRRLDELVDLVGELVVAHAMLAQDAAVTDDPHSALADRVVHTAKIVRELQQVGIGLRMVPLRPLFQRLHRLVRDLAAQSSKQVELVMTGEETEIDRAMVEGLTDPLVHMIRNAIDHALEAPAERTACGKPAAGTLRLSAQHAGGAVVITLEDDGRGLDRAQIVRRATARGIALPEHELSTAEIDALIFAPGLSTAESVTALSGRGVGMDVVKRNIDALRGQIEIASVAGAGTTFIVRLPLTLAVTDGLLVRVAGERYIVPTSSVMTSFRPTASALVREARGGELVMLHGEPVPVVRLHHVLGIDGAVTDPTAALLVVVEIGRERFAVLVDELLGQQQLVAKPLAHGLGSVPGMAGSAVLADGRVGLILDPSGLLGAARRLAPWADGRKPAA